MPARHYRGRGCSDGLLRRHAQSAAPCWVMLGGLDAIFPPTIHRANRIRYRYYSQFKWYRVADCDPELAVFCNETTSAMYALRPGLGSRFHPTTRGVRPPQTWPIHSSPSSAAWWRVQRPCIWNWDVLEIGSNTNPTRKLGFPRRRAD